MPTANRFSVGDDIVLVARTSTGDLQIPVTDFTADPQYDDLVSRQIGKPPIHDFIPKGWMGSFKMDRTSPDVDNQFAALEAAYWNGTLQGPGTIFQTVTEADGSITQWRYTKVAYKLAKAGDYNGPKKVEQTINFMASRKEKVA